MRKSFKRSIWKWTVF